jgi:uncharacterized secreted repeat protein (TIGR03808 family)
MATISTDDVIVFNGGTSTDLQNAINTAMKNGRALYLTPALASPTVPTVYTVSNLEIRPQAANDNKKALRLFAAPGSVTLKLGASADYILKIENASEVEISGIGFDASYDPAASSPITVTWGAIYALLSNRIRIEKCRIFSSSSVGIRLDRCGTQTSFSPPSVWWPYGEPYGASVGLKDNAGIIIDNEIFACFNSGLNAGRSPGLLVKNNVIRSIEGNGIDVSNWDFVSRTGPDDTSLFYSQFSGIQIEDNLITDIDVIDPSSTGQEGNGISCWLANNVVVSNNIVRYCKFSAARFNSCTAIQVTCNNCYALGETALYCEEPDGSYVPASHPVQSIFANNGVNQCRNGITVTNFVHNNAGCRLSTVANNIVRNCHGPEGNGHGISVNGDTTVTGNIVECCDAEGIALGVNDNTRDLIVTGNLVRNCLWGIAAATDGGEVLINSNMVHVANPTTNGIVRSVYLGSSSGTAYGPALPNASYPNVKVSGNNVHNATIPTTPSDACEPAPSF